MTLRNIVALMFTLAMLQGCGEKNDCETIASKFRAAEKNFNEAAKYANSNIDKSCNLWRKNIDILKSINVEKAEKECSAFKKERGYLLVAQSIGNANGFMQSKRCSSN